MNKTPTLIPAISDQIMRLECCHVVHYRLQPDRNAVLVVLAGEHNRAATLLLSDHARHFDPMIRLIEEVAAQATTDHQIRLKAIGPQEALDKIQKLVCRHPGLVLEGAKALVNEPEAYFFVETGKLRVAQADAMPAPAPVKKAKTKTRVLVVDDSKTIRNLLTKVISSDPEMEVVGAADRPSAAETMIRELKPDVITLDIHMPEMDGVTFLEKFLPTYPLPVIMISSISMEESTYVLRALEIGAVDYIQKPSMDQLSVVAPLIIEKIKIAASTRVHEKVRTRPSTTVAPSLVTSGTDYNRIVAIGSSTGGTEALRVILTMFPKEIPPILIAQHIPPVFSKAFADRLNQMCPFEVIEGKDGDEVIRNRVIIAPGGFQMSLVNGKNGYRVKIEDRPPVNRHKPSVDYLFDSVAETAGRKAVGIILTGMGADGAKGLLKMKEAGARTIAQDEASCVVFGMPKEAIKLGAAEKICPLETIPETLFRMLTKAAAA